MNDIEKKLKGSQIANSGFLSEKEIANKFNNWQIDKEAKCWLEIMKYDTSEIQSVCAKVINGHKADINVQITIKLRKTISVENLQVKLVSNKKGYNQVDKHWASKCAELWDMPNTTLEILKYFAGELKPYIPTSRNKKKNVF